MFSVLLNLKYKGSKNNSYNNDDKSNTFLHTKTVKISKFVDNSNNFKAASVRPLLFF